MKEEKDKAEEVEEDYEKVNAEIMAMVFDEEAKAKADKMIAYVDKRFGLNALENESSYEEGNLIEEIIHYMRWDPEFLFDCQVKKLHEYEMALAAHIVFVNARSNHWQVMCDMADRDLQRAVRLASNRFKSVKTLTERKALAMETFPALRKKEKELDVYNIYKEKCKKMVDVLTQMDNSLKKTLDKRKHERLIGNV